MDAMEQRIEDAYNALAEACRAFGHTVEVTCADDAIFPVGLTIDGCRIHVDIRAEQKSGPWVTRHTGRLAICYKCNNRPRPRAEAKAGFPYNDLAADICEEAGRQTSAAKAETERRLRVAAAEKIANAVNEICGVEETTSEVDRLINHRSWFGPQADATYNGELTVVLSHVDRAHSLLPCTPDEARELVTVAQRIYRAHKV